MDEVAGTVVSWDAEEGWGVLTSPSVPGEVWAHFSAVAGPSYGSLNEGEAVLFTYERARQDGYDHRAVSVRRPGQTDAPGTGKAGPYSSRLEITFD
ncbi:cold-shock protein [Streptosporangium saharense]|uniref:cold-shock protein n=1 Tax=Streptosporangium saharense TaxID=1706840 RepID=UPI00343114DE